MGFYSASTLLEDARRKGVPILPFCVERSAWECSLETPDGLADGQLQLSSDGQPFALRLGLKFMKGLSESVVRRIVQGRPYTSARELALRAQLDRRTLEVLSAGGALDVYGRGRRSELWAVDEHVLARSLTLLATWEEEVRQFAPLEEDEEIVWDYEVSGLSPRGHPMRALRPALRKAGFLEAREVGRISHGGWARTAAMVICRQRPATAKGTVFLTLEDETGFVNVILWPRVFEDNFVVARSAGLLAVEGPVQNGRGVVHLVARKLYRPELDASVEVGSRNFH
jgi:error-prone DNA polymerase